MRAGRATVIYALSLALHAGLAMGVALIKKRAVRETVTVTMREVRAARTAPGPLPPAVNTPSPAPAPLAAPAPTAAPRVAAHRAARIAPVVHAAPPPAAAPAASNSGGNGGPDFGLSFAGGVSSGGIAIPGGGNGGGTSSAPSRTVAARTLAPAPASDGCDEPIVRPRALSVPQPAFPDEARAAGIEGRVRVELTVDARGEVTAARVLQSLGHGLDEAALTAARAGRFEPATRCGRAVPHTFVISMRFAL